MFLDTTFCIDLLREGRSVPAKATAALERLGDSPLFVSVFVVCELHAGARLSKNAQENLRSIERLAAQLTIIYPDVAFPVAYAELEVALRREGNPIPTTDLLIGTTAKMLGMPILTRDNDHFRRIPGLVVETY